MGHEKRVKEGKKNKERKEKWKRNGNKTDRPLRRGKAQISSGMVPLS